ncbi:MAG TPA: hypothetical protein VMP38_07535, partial [Candidatus Acidoferrum sp.]|nr:hypothetical protein [Candidatus Acidoferrum sp.]
LRSEAHHLGALVRTIVTCETCHRTLSSTIGVATAAEPEPAKVEAHADGELVETAPPKAAAGARKPATAKKPAATTSAAKRLAGKKASPTKPGSTATRKTTRAK